VRRKYAVNQSVVNRFQRIAKTSLVRVASIYLRDIGRLAIVVDTAQALRYGQS
jgi:hypothetical protein